MTAARSVPWPTEGLSFGGDYSPEQWPREVWDEDVRLMREGRGEPGHGRGVLVGAARAVTGAVHLVVARRGARPAARQRDRGRPRDPDGGPPNWLLTAHPEVLPVDATERRERPGGRLGWCPASPVFRAHALRIVEAIAERYGRHPPCGCGTSATSSAAATPVASARCRRRTSDGGSASGTPTSTRRTRPGARPSGGTPTRRSTRSRRHAGSEGRRTRASHSTSSGTRRTPCSRTTSPSGRSSSSTRTSRSRRTSWSARARTSSTTPGGHGTSRSRRTTTTRWWTTRTGPRTSRPPPTGCAASPAVGPRGCSWSTRPAGRAGSSATVRRSPVSWSGTRSRTSPRVGRRAVLPVACVDGRCRAVPLRDGPARRYPHPGLA